MESDNRFHIILTDKGTGLSYSGSAETAELACEMAQAAITRANAELEGSNA